ncbi:hypothetical protein DP939_25150 [Spongiactinospora rosea]|uniref:Bacterial transcriptional activator domain-containing protein n=1 Tax=Spongiactinospora rosea TaxID=2248750 RepID=A0A366LU03_9ACTN|nr:bacterial transcriptional activator domain-containing protein [Spongiactinospora rosea]RBQ17237.1 hypothetical protein DP939_25150 [Spongiactinospora rosea]
MTSRRQLGPGPGPDRVALRAAGSAVLLAAVLLGLPLTLLWMAGSPIPQRLPAWPDVHAALLRPDDGSLLLGVIKYIGWLSWLCFAGSVILELAARLLRRPAPLLPGISGIQRLATRLLTSISLLITSAHLTPATSGNALPVAASTYLGSPPPAPASAPTQPPSSGSAPATVPVLSITFAGGMLAGGILATLTRLRHRQRQHRQPGHRIALPAAPEAVREERRLHRLAADTVPPRIHQALNTFATALHAAGRPVPDVLALHVTADAAELWLPPPAPAPSPFVAVASLGHGSQADAIVRWRLPQPDAAVSTGRPGLTPLPGLLTIGRTHHGGHLLIDTETLGLITCHGPADLINEVLHAAAIEAATTGSREVLLVGFPHLTALAPPALPEAARHLPSLDAALEALTRRREEIHQIHTDDLRTRRAHAPLACPAFTLLISTIPPTPDEEQRLAAITTSPGLAALIPCPPSIGADHSPSARLPDPAIPLHPQRARLETVAITPAGEFQLRLHTYGITLHPQRLTTGQITAITTLLATATDLASTPADPPPAALSPAHNGHRAQRGTRSASPPASARSAAEPHRQHGPAGTVRLCLLGPVELHGTASPLRPKHLELVVLLAVHGKLHRDQLRTFLGPDPDHPKPADQVRQLISRTRGQLGPTPDGTDRILHDGHSIYRLDEIEVDWDHFQHLATTRRRDATAVDDLTAALNLVRGRPIADRDYWWLDPQITETMTAAIIDTAHQLATLHLEAAEPGAAATTARRGLATDPTAEQLWRVLMSAEHAAGNITAVHHAWQSCLAQIADIAMDGEPHPATTRLYRRLTSPSAARTPRRS